MGLSAAWFPSAVLDCVSFKDRACLIQFSIQSTSSQVWQEHEHSPSTKSMDDFMVNMQDSAKNGLFAWYAATVSANTTKAMKIHFLPLPSPLPSFLIFPTPQRPEPLILQDALRLKSRAGHTSLLPQLLHCWAPSLVVYIWAFLSPI